MCFKLLCRSNGVRAVFAFQFSVIFCPGKEKIQHLLNDCYQVRMVDWFWTKSLGLEGSHFKLFQIYYVILALYKIIIILNIYIYIYNFHRQKSSNLHMKVSSCKFQSIGTMFLYRLQSDCKWGLWQRCSRSRWRQLRSSWRCPIPSVKLRVMPTRWLVKTDE